jgi:hypothetical protein
MSSIISYYKAKKNQILFYAFTIGITIGGFFISTRILQNESETKIRKRDAIFYDRIRMNERRIANGYPPLRDEDINDEAFLREWQDFKRRKGIKD